MSFLLLSHVVFHKDVPIYGPVQILEKFLREKKQNVLVAYLPLFFEGRYIQTGASAQQEIKQFSGNISKYLFDIWYCFSFIKNNKPTKDDVVIAVDPLNCISGVFFKLVKRYHLVYYTADYTENRFNNFFLNSIYHILDQICLRFCDQNWCVSERIEKLRKKQTTPGKVFFVPNTPILPEFKPRVQTNKLKNKLIYVGAMDDSMHISLLLNVMKDFVSNKKNITLTLIGSGPMHEQIAKYIKKYSLQKHISFLGPQENKIVIKHIQKNGIGLALYSGEKLWNNYGDSMKIREYQYFGLPVITTSVPSNSSEIDQFDCGVVFHTAVITKQKLYRAINEIQQNYDIFSKNTLLVTKKRDKNKILTQLLQPYLT